MAYLLPSLHKVFLQEKKKKTSREKTTNPRVIVLVPTRELATQVRKECQEILKHCGDDDEEIPRRGVTARFERLRGGSRSGEELSGRVGVYAGARGAMSEG